MSELHKRASIWYENHGLEIEAFQHAAAANDVEHAARLIEGKGTPGVQRMPGIQGMPLHYRGAVAPVLNWLESLPTTVLDARPSLWVMYASALVFSGQSTSAEPKLQAAEAAFAEAAAAKETARASAAAKAALPAHGQGTEPVATEALASAVEGPDDETKDLVGQIAALRAMVALRQRQIETIIAQAHRALEYLHPYNLPVRTATNWTLALAHQFQGDRAAARQAYAETISICQASGNVFINILASTGLGILQEEENELHLAAETYRRVLQLAGDPPQPSACEAHLGLARILYEWNDLDAAQQHGQQSVLLIRQLGSVETFAPYGVFLARLKLARGDVSGASAILTEADQFLRQHNHLHRMPEVAAAQVGVLLKQGDLASAADLAERHELPVSQARVHLASGDAGEALALLEPLRQQVEAKGWGDERLKVLVLQAIALHAAALQADGDAEKAIQRLGEALAMAEPGGFIRT
ncbi:MAG: hypothetical protein GWN58_48570, partial [Anaerolineae bacterium]|nr:hypothetical protein [Anaerolineae bacterium]